MRYVDDVMSKFVVKSTDDVLVNGSKNSISNISDDFVETSSKGTGGGNSNNVKFGSDVKSSQKLTNQMSNRGWTEASVKNTIDAPYTTRSSTNLATGNSATVYYNQNGAHVIVDNMTKEIVQVSDALNIGKWIPDPNIVNPYKP